MIIFLPQDENKSVFYRKKLAFFVYYKLSVILNKSVVIKNGWLLYIKCIDLNIKPYPANTESDLPLPPV